MEEDIKNKIEFRGFVVSRLADWAREYIRQRAKDEFADDYGALLVYLIQQTNEYELLKGKFLHGELPIKLGFGEPEKPKNEPKTMNLGNGMPTKFKMEENNGKN